MYLEGGLEPARFVIMKSMVMYLQYILQQTDDCLLITMLKAQADSPTKDDWLSEVTSVISYLELNITFEEIKQLTKSQFHKMVKKQTRSKAFSYLSEKQENWSKGKAIQYSGGLQMAEYILPNKYFTFEDQI